MRSIRDYPGVVKGNGRLEGTARLYSGSVGHRAAERRNKIRIYEPFPAKVSGVDQAGKPFEVETALDNLSSGGLYVRLLREVEQGAELSVVVRLSRDASEKVMAPRVSARGVVLRSEPQSDGRRGLAVRLTRYRLL